MLVACQKIQELVKEARDKNVIAPPPTLPPNPPNPRNLPKCTKKPRAFIYVPPSTCICVYVYVYLYIYIYIHICTYLYLVPRWAEALALICVEWTLWDWLARRFFLQSLGCSWQTVLKKRGSSNCSRCSWETACIGKSFQLSQGPMERARAKQDPQSWDLQTNNAGR